MEVIIAFTGHTNIEKCCGLPVPENGNVYDKSAYDRVYNDLSMFMEKLSKLKNIPLNNFKIVSGMARGFDEVVAMYAINMNLDLILSIPHSIKWHKDRSPSRNGELRAQAIWYDYILAYPKLTIREVPKGNEFFVNFARNIDMIDISKVVVSYKKYDSSGTDHCIKEAKKRNKYLGNIPDILLEKQND